jgi:UDP-N-acetyl-D-glucosamine dehydrogenase
MTREHPQWAGVKSIAWEAGTIKDFDLTLIATKHAVVDYAALAQWADCIVDTRNAMAGLATRPGQVRKS